MRGWKNGDFNSPKLFSHSDILFSINFIFFLIWFSKKFKLFLFSCFPNNNDDGSLSKHLTSFPSRKFHNYFYYYFRYVGEYLGMERVKSTQILYDVRDDFNDREKNLHTNAHC